MSDFGLFAERDPVRAARKFDQLERFAKHRENHLEHIDLDALDRSTAFNILQTDEDLADALMFAPLYIHHLETLETQRAEIAAVLPQAA